jgi:hypothetical protein
MSYSVMESMVRQRLRDKKGQVSCADCLAKDLRQGPNAVKVAMDALVRGMSFRARRCPCGKAGIMYVG